MTTTEPAVQPTSERAGVERWMGRGASHRRFDVAVAVVLVVATMALLLATDQMGFARDEAFYFGHAETYQNWQIELEAGGDRRRAALERDAILRTWRDNAEHPPLDKLLFGWSWRLFGRKLREVGAFSPVVGGDGAGGAAGAGVVIPPAAADAVRAEVRGLGPAHGFEPSAAVWLLAPQRVGEAADIAPRRIGHGVVVARSSHAASVRLDDHPGLEALRTRCQSAGSVVDGGLLRTGCEVVEDRPLALLSESAAMRAPGMLFAALLVGLIWLFARGVASGQPWLARPFALLAAVGYLAIPRAFFHAHLACFDMTITTLLVATTLAYHRSLSRRGFVWLTAALWGLSLLAKHNAFVLPIAFIGHWLWDGLMEGRIRLVTGEPPAGRSGRVARLGAVAVCAVAAAVLLAPIAGVAVAALGLAAGGRRLELPPLPLAWFVMLPVGLGMLVAGWPLLWVDTAQHLLAWIEFHLHHEHYMQTYFGAVLAYPPFPVGLPWVLTLLTWPPSLLVGVGAGLLVLGLGAWRRWVGPGALARLGARIWPSAEALSPAESTVLEPELAAARSLDRLLVLTALWPIVLISLPSTPVFGGTKHWMTAYPALLLIGARGLQWAWFGAVAPLLAGGVAARARAAALAWALVAASILPAAAATLAHHPHGTTYYNELVGGVPGAAYAGLQRQFWGYQAREGLEVVNRLAPQRARIWFHNSAWGSYMMYAREGWLRRDLAYGGGPEGTTLGLFHHQYDHDDYELEMMADYGVAAPVAQTALEGVPLLSVYERPSNVARRPLTAPATMAPPR